MDELVQKLREQFEKIEEQMYNINYGLDEIDEHLNEKETIKDVDNFIWNLKNENLYSEELEKFIEYYLKFHNK